MSKDTSANPFVPPKAMIDDVALAGTDSSFELRLFSPAGRIGRLRYLGYMMALSFLLLLLGGTLTVKVGPLAMVLAFGGIIYVHLMLAIKRCHDFNWTGWFALLTLVPLVALIFLFIPGTDGPNRFGNKTAPSTGGGLLVAAMLVFVAVGILAAIAVPAYSDYRGRIGGH